MPRWDDVRVLLAALRTGSFTLAARALDADQSTVSRRIAALEESIGAPLFERTPRGPVPTELGEALRERAEAVEAELVRFADAARGSRERGVRGRVRLALTESLATHFVIPRVLPSLRAAHPELVVELVTGYRAVDLAAREADVALRFFRTERGDLVGRRVARLPTGVLAARSLARKLRGRSLQALDWIAVELDGIPTPESAWLAAHAGVEPVLVCTSFDSQIAAIRAGLGVGLGARALARAHRDLVVLEGPHPPGPSLELHVVARRAIRDVPRVAAVVDALTEQLAGLEE